MSDVPTTPRRHSLRTVIVVVFAVGMTLVATQLVGAATSGSRDRTAPGRATAPSSVKKFSTAGKSSKFNAVDATDNPSTTSTAYVDMPSMAVTFTFGGTTSRSVLVTFSGEWIGCAAAQDRALLRLTIDGVVQSGPGDAASPFSAHEGTEDSSNGFTFISDPVTPGTHTARIQWASVGGAAICVDERSMSVLHG